jgi:hypothetical protein
MITIICVALICVTAYLLLRKGFTIKHIHVQELPPTLPLPELSEEEARKLQEVQDGVAKVITSINQYMTGGADHE